RTTTRRESLSATPGLLHFELVVHVIRAAVADDGVVEAGAFGRDRGLSISGECADDGLHRLAFAARGERDFEFAVLVEREQEVVTGDREVLSRGNRTHPIDDVNAIGR